MKTLNKISLLAIIAILSLSFTTKETVKTKTFYYYAYATTGVNAEVYDKVWITPLQQITIDTDSYYEIEKYGLANQFRDYMEAHYNFSASDVLNTKGDVYEVGVFDKATATKYYRETLNRFNSISKVYDFSFTKERN